MLQITKVDFAAFEVIDKLLLFDATVFEDSQRLVEFHGRISVSKIKETMLSLVKST